MILTIKSDRAVQQYESVQKWLKRLDSRAEKNIARSEMEVVRRKILAKINRFIREAQVAEREAIINYNLPQNYYENPKLTKTLITEEVKPKTDIESAVMMALLAADRIIVALIEADIEVYPPEYWEEGSLCTGNDDLHRWHERVRVVLDKVKKISRPLIID